MAIVPPGPSPATPDPWIAARRTLLHAQEYDLGGLRPGRLGIAFSGGGIRSATISLGVAQALARDKRLLDFDTMSTVSGGGYFGGFLRSLFLPQGVRGSGAALDPAGAARTVTRRALDVLESEPDARMIPGTRLTNPVRWLRENSRYLAPAGPTDYLVAASYIIRNWVAMLFVFALPTLLFFLLVHGFLHVAEHFGLPGQFSSWAVPDTHYRVSSIIALPALLLIAGILWGIANWWTVFAGGNWLHAQVANAEVTPASNIVASALLALAAGLILLIFGSHYGDGAAARLVAALAVALGTGAVGGALVAIATTRRVARTEPQIGNDLFANELRRVLTATNALINAWLIVLLALAVIDTVAIALIDTIGSGGVKTLAALSALAPLGRLLIQKLQASFGKASPGGAFGAFVARYIWQVAFVAAVLLWGSFAVLLDVAVRSIAYPVDGPWWTAWLAGLVIIAVTAAATGASTGFINLSSLHSLYAARLTRAYLGATNEDRLADQTKGITGYETRDVIRADIYQQQLCAAPLHLINVTLNETISATGSQLLERDRKGVPMVIAPEGIWIDAALAAPGAAHAAQTAQAAPGAPASAPAPQPACDWAVFDQTGAEPFSVGQLTAISGAAFSSAMGSRTTLGGSLLFTYANIRLGYWWPRGSIGSRPDDPPDRLRSTGTFGYLLREMLGRYRSTTARVNLSDGGHFDNTGLYELLRRRTPVIVFCDNGEDAEYHFEDLEILVRKARLDIGVSVEVASPGEVLGAVSVSGAKIFLNGQVGDWRARARSRGHTDPAFALLLLVRDANCRVIGAIVLLKPSLFGALPADVWGYAEEHLSFPHESTSDQFFTEAQWESYRKLGFMMMQQLLRASPHRENLFREL